MHALYVNAKLNNVSKMLDAGSEIASIIGAVTGGRTSDTNKGDVFTVGVPSNTGKGTFGNIIII